MSYKSISELPKTARNLPNRAKTIYLKAYNSTWEDYVDVHNEMAREKASHNAAWIAVKEEYMKDEETGAWIKIDMLAGRRSRHSQKHRRNRSGGASETKAHA